MDFFEKNMWDIVAITVAVIIPSILYILQQKKNRKSLSFEILQDRLDIASKALYDGLKIFYKDKQVDHLFLYVLKIINDGSTHISSSDYETPIRITFEDSTELLSVELIKQSPKSLVLDLTISDNSIHIQPTLLNSKDFFTFKVLLSGFPENGFNMVARIQGVKEIKRKTPKNKPLYLIYLGFNLVCLGSILTIALVMLKLIYVSLSDIIVGSILIFISYASIIIVAKRFLPK